MSVLGAAGQEKFLQGLAGFSLLPALFMVLALPLALLAATRLRRHLARTVDRLAAAPGLALLVGTTAFIVALVLLAGSAASPVVGVLALLVAGTTGVFTLLGLAAEARRLGGELRDRELDAGAAEGGSAAVGWLVLAGLPLLPGAGPLVLLYLALRSTGAAVLAVAGR